MLKGFDPLISKAPVIMILGSMPSVSSLQKQEYYGFSQNRFWKILHEVYHMPIDTYEQKKQIIFDHQLFLWDVIGECERIGSLDSNIKNEKVNDIAGYLSAYPSIQKIICNGRKSYDLFTRHVKELNIPCIYVPSTSNANRSIKEEVLFEEWKQALRTDQL